jgi:hypothetical protein
MQGLIEITLARKRTQDEGPRNYEFSSMMSGNTGAAADFRPAPNFFPLTPVESHAR